LGTVGEPINPEAWVWYHKMIGGGRCPVVDTWWQTETGSIMMTTLPGAAYSKPGSTGLPFFGVVADIVTKDGKTVTEGGGLLVLVTLKPGNEANADLKKKLVLQVEQEIGKFARPDVIRFADALPKTRSGKIMRRLLKDVAAGTEAKGDTSTLEDLSVLAKLRADEE